MDADQQLIPDDLSERPFEPFDGDERTFVVRPEAEREGQGAFRTRVLDAYGRRCAITGEHTEPVLDAAHIQPYRGTRSNHVQNGLLLTKEFHALFDLGYVAVTPEHEVLVSPTLERDWHNGKRYYPFDHQRLAVLPKRADLLPSPRALEWHLANVFRRAS
jgi:putative restriction endonuclease